MPLSFVCFAFSQCGANTAARLLSSWTLACQPSYARQPEGKVGVGGPAGEAPACLVGTTVLRPTPLAGGPMPERARAYARRRHPLAHLYAEQSLQFGSWTGRDAGWADHVPRSHVTRRLGQCTVRRPAGGRTIWLARTGPPARERKQERKRRREPLERPAVPDRKLCRGALLWPAQGTKSKGPGTGFRNRRWCKLRQVQTETGETGATAW